MTDEVKKWYNELKRLSMLPFDQYQSVCPYCDQCKPDEEWQPISKCCPHLDEIMKHIEKFPKEE